MSVNTLHEGCDLDTSRVKVNQNMAALGLTGGNMDLTAGGGNGTGCGLNDAICAQELRTHNSAAGSTEQQLWSPA